MIDSIFFLNNSSSQYLNLSFFFSYYRYYPLYLVPVLYLVPGTPIRLSVRTYSYNTWYYLPPQNHFSSSQSYYMTPLQMKSTTCFIIHNFLP